jgi:gliding motility-associated-like protein
MRKSLFILVWIMFAYCAHSQPGKDGTLTVSSTTQVINKYCPVTSSISSGANTVAIISSTFLPLCPGDLIMVYQAQGATINTTNTSSYGDITAYNSAGLYEFKYIQSVSGNTITTQTTFTNSYSAAGKTQVIKVPQYTTLTINVGSTILARPWKDTTVSSVVYRLGGLIVIHAANIVNNGTITCDGSGFRGGTIFYNSSSSLNLGVTAFTSTNSTQGGEKGESITGSQTDYDANGGRYCMGAPSNGGGGGNAHNSGGGGGANGFNGNTWTGQGVMIVDANNPLTAWSLSSGYTANSNALTNSSGGGHAGYSYGGSNQNALSVGPGNTLWSGDYRREVGGIGGHPLTNINAETRIYFGGGGGGPEANNNASNSGSNGGGIVYLIATSGISGSGLISSEGNTAGNANGCSCDGAPGAGAGGSIIIKTPTIPATQTVSVKGGKGGDQNTLNPPGSQSVESEGPGGGGGGGFAAISAGAIVPVITGGMNGSSASGAVTEFPFNGATSGATGETGSVTTSFISFTPVATVTLSNNGPLCAGATLILNSTSTVIAWSGPNSFTSSVQNPTISNVSTSATGIYTTSISGGGCVLTQTTSVTVYSQPTLSVVNSSLACPGYSNATATCTVAGGSGTFNYVWSGFSQTTSSISGLSAGLYTVTASDATTSCISSKTFQVVQPPTFSLNLSSSSPTACLGSSITLGANLSGGTPGYTYSWTSGPATSSYVVGEPAAGTYVYSITINDSHNCIVNNTISATFFSNPALNTFSISACPSVISTLTVNGASTYTWQPGNAVGSSFTVNPSVASTYTVTGTSAQGCSASAITSVNIKPSPNFSFNSYTINCANLGSATVTAGGTPGPFSFTWTPTAQTSSLATGMFPGNYTVDVFDASTGCAFSPTTNFAALVPLTGTVSSTPSLVCFGDANGSASISLSGGSGTQSYTWTNPSGPQSSSVALALSGGVHTVNVSDGLTFCSLTHTFFISQPPAFTLNIGASSPSVCLGASISFTALNSGGTPGYTYSWTGGPSTNTLSTNETISGTYTYVVTSKDVNNCVFSNSITGKFVPNPTVSVSNTSVCPLSVGTLTASGATSYSWINNGSTSNPLSTSPPATTEYTVVGSTAGCTGSATGSITIKPAPTATFSSNAPVCQGDSLKLFSLNTQSLYLWSGPGSFSSALQSVTFYSVMPAMSGNYILKITAANGCTASITKSLTVNPTPPISISVNTVCQGQTLQLHANYLQAGLYSWVGPVNTSSLANPGFTNAIPAMSGVYSLTITSAQGCTNVASTHGSVIATPVPIITSGNQYCVGSNIQLSGSGGNSYQWFGPNFFSSSLQNPLIQTIGLNASGQYSLYSYVSSCYGLAVQNITVHPVPIVTALNTGPVCESTSVTFSSAFPASTYSWSGPAGFTSTLAVPSINTASLSNTGVYTLNITDGNNCMGSAVTSLSVIPAPTVTAKDVTVCLGGPATLSALGGTSYSWTGPAGYSSSLQVVYLAVVNSSNTGNYFVVVSGSNSCKTQALVQLTGILDTLPVPLIHAPQKACLNSEVILHGSGGAVYSWAGPGNFTATGEDVMIIAKDSSAAGIYTLTARNKNNCINTTTLALNFYPLPKADLLSNKNNVCVPFCSSLSVSEPYLFPLNYLVNGQSNVNASKDSVFSYCFNTAGSYTIQVRFIDSNFCTNSATLAMNAFPKPYANFEFSPTNPLAGIDRVQFLNTSRSTYQGEWKWFLQGNDSVFVTEKDPRFLYEQAGTYPLVLVAKNIFGCMDTVIKVLVVEDEFSIYVPNAFTPNGDGLNDNFFPKGQGIKSFNLEVYDRWGEKVFHTVDFYSYWDGTFRGKECKSDVYSWKIVASGFSGKIKTFTGHVSLLRAQVMEE